MMKTKNKDVRMNRQWIWIVVGVNKGKTVENIQVLRIPTLKAKKLLEGFYTAGLIIDLCCSYYGKYQKGAVMWLEAHPPPRNTKEEREEEREAVSQQIPQNEQKGILFVFSRTERTFYVCQDIDVILWNPQRRVSECKKWVLCFRCFVCHFIRRQDDF